MIEIQGFSAFIIPPYKKEVLADYSTDIHNNEKIRTTDLHKRKKSGSATGLAAQIVIHLKFLE